MLETCFWLFVLFVGVNFIHWGARKCGFSPVTARVMATCFGVGAIWLAVAGYKWVFNFIGLI